ncbi:mRNA-decapping enzyme subunit 1-like protein [Cladobotryum mycophilum]|uniref:mRNA-decapping enzyme subunit 1-like protein n=1 Tax=Cladobotryum mycophilum TaxID=491253 RepID=A0ABR0SWK4_9HYPO
MSRTTPRKSRHNRHPSNRIPAISDYESDRYLPSISRILSIAANAVIYTFDSNTEGWEKSGIEGTMFVCAQMPLPNDVNNRPRACVFVLNRRGLDNVIVDLARVSHVEIMGELVIIKAEGDWGEGEKVLGVWIHNDEEETRATNGAIIEESWKIARAAGTIAREGPEAGPAMQAIGRPLTLNELFGKQVSNVGH